MSVKINPSYKQRLSEWALTSLVEELTGERGLLTRYNDPSLLHALSLFEPQEMPELARQLIAARFGIDRRPRPLARRYADASRQYSASNPPPPCDLSLKAMSEAAYRALAGDFSTKGVKRGAREIIYREDIGAFVLETEIEFGRGAHRVRYFQSLWTDRNERVFHHLSLLSLWGLEGGTGWNFRDEPGADAAFQSLAECVEILRSARPWEGTTGT